MSSRYGGRGYGRYGDPEEDRTDERFYERDAERGYGAQGARPERGSEYGGLRRGGYAGGRGGFEREYGQGRERDARDLGPRYGTREQGGGDYGSRYGREVFERGGYAGSPRRHEGEEYGRARGRDYERRAERAYRHDAAADEVRDYDTDYGRTTSRFYGRSGYEYGREDYEDDRRREARGRDEDRGHDGGNWLDRAADQVRSWFGGEEDDRERGRHEEQRRAYVRGEGKFRGRGPKNYRRSDDRLREEVCDRLTDNEWLDASDVEVNVVVGEVILTGAVDSRYAKRLAENIAESVSGVSNVQNNLRVLSYQTNAEAPLAGMDTPLPTATTATLPAADITATSTTDETDVNDLGRPSSRAAGQS
ncbi:MAG: BON domain-containing protein [Acidobacteria bacterium]|nr:BON domain-containing protein [Acidobacteriota bacterium]